jgi:ketopantoate reductase
VTTRRSLASLTSIVLGKPPIGTAAWQKVVDFTERCKRAGFGAAISEDVRGVLWSKLIGLSTQSALTTASRRPSGDLYNDPEIVEVATALIAEASAVARAQGVQLPDGLEGEWLRMRYNGSVQMIRCLTLVRCLQPCLPMRITNLDDLCWYPSNAIR